MKIANILMILMLVSCSTMKKSMIYPAVGGGLTGAIAGYSLSDENKGHDKAGNALIWGTISALIGSGIGYLLYKDHPENQKLTHAMDIEDILTPEEKQSVSIPMNHSKTIELKASNEEVIPDELKNRLKKPKVQIFEVPERIIEENGKQMIIEKTRGFKYVIE